MGPRSIDRGNESPSKIAGTDRGASMGPRSIDRGNTDNTKIIDRAKYASMGPRSIDRGNRGTRHQARTHLAGFNGAAIDRSRKSVDGHGNDEPNPRFNGAAIDRSRKSSRAGRRN